MFDCKSQYSRNTSDIIFIPRIRMSTREMTNLLRLGAPNRKKYLKELPTKWPSQKLQGLFYELLPNYCHMLKYNTFFEGAFRAKLSHLGKNSYVGFLYDQVLNEKSHILASDCRTNKVREFQTLELPEV